MSRTIACRPLRKIRIRLKAYDHKLLDQSATEIVDIARRTGAGRSGTNPIANQHKPLHVLRGPHVNKKSREQFELRTHKRLLDILEPTPQTLDALDEARFISWRQCRAEVIRGKDGNDFRLVT